MRTADQSPTILYYREISMKEEGGGRRLVKRKKGGGAGVWSCVTNHIWRFGLLLHQLCSMKKWREVQTADIPSSDSLCVNLTHTLTHSRYVNPAGSVCLHGVSLTHGGNVAAGVCFMSTRGGGVEERRLSLRPFGSEKKRSYKTTTALKPWKNTTAVFVSVKSSKHLMFMFMWQKTSESKETVSSAVYLLRLGLNRSINLTSGFVSV